MEKRITTVGLDLAKSVFQVHAIDGEGEMVVRRKLSRSRVLAFFGSLEPCLIGMEACATAHHWARQLGFTKHPWLARLLERKPVMVAAIALANKLGRTIWALMIRGDRYDPARLASA